MFTLIKRKPKKGSTTPPPIAPQVVKTTLLSSAWIEAIIFGSIWGIFEITLGVFLHSLTTPFLILLPAIIGMLLLIIGYSIFPRAGFCMRAVFICLILKIFGPMGTRTDPLIMLFFEALIIELVFLIPIKKMSAFLSGCLVVAWILSYKYVFFALYFGKKISKIYFELIKLFLTSFGLQTSDTTAGTVILILFLLSGGILGLMGGILGSHTASKYWEEKI